MVGEDAAALEEGAAAVELHELGGEVAVFHAQQVAEELKAEFALIGNVVYGEQGLHASVDVVAVLGAQQHGDHGRMPVVAVEHIREETEVGYCVEHGAGEEGILLAFGHAAAVYAVAEVVLVVYKGIWSRRRATSFSMPTYWLRQPRSTEKLNMCSTWSWYLSLTQR